MKTTDSKDVIKLNLENVNKSIGNQKNDKSQSMVPKKGLKMTSKERPSTIQGSPKKSFRPEYHTSDNAAKKIQKMAPNAQPGRPLMQMISEAPMNQPRMRSNFLMMSSGSSTNPASEHVTDRGQLPGGEKHAHILSGSATVGEEQGGDIKKRLAKLKTKEEHDKKPKIIEQLNQFMGLRRQNVFVDQQNSVDRSNSRGSEASSDLSVELYKEILDSILSPTKMGPQECSKNMIEFQVYKGNTIIKSRQQNLDNLQGVRPGSQGTNIQEVEKRSGSTSSLHTDSDLGLTSEEEGQNKEEDFQLFQNTVNAANIYDDTLSAQTSGAPKSTELKARSADKQPLMNTAQSQQSLKDPIKAENSDAIIDSGAPHPLKKNNQTMGLKSRMRASQEQSPLAPIETGDSAITISDEKNIINPKQVSTIRASQLPLLPNAPNDGQVVTIQMTNNERPTTSGENSLQGTRRNKINHTQHQKTLKGAIIVEDSRAQSNIVTAPVGKVGITTGTGTTNTVKQQTKAGRQKIVTKGTTVTHVEEAPAYPPMSHRQKRVVKVLSSQQAARNQMDIEYLGEYFNEFDFLKKEQVSATEKQKKKMETIISKATDGAADQSKRSLRKRQAIMMANEGESALGSSAGGQSMAKDKKSVEQMCWVMRYLSIPKHGQVFDYDSAGDLFYMLLHGKVDCKVPFHKQIIHLSEAEYKMFIEEYKEDLLNIQDAKDINQMVKEKKSVEAHISSRFANPYDLSYEKLQERVNKALEKEKYKLLRPLWDEQRKLQKKRHRSAASGEETEEEDNFQSRSQISLQTGIQELLDSARQSYTASQPSRKDGGKSGNAADNTSSLKTINAMFRGKQLSHKEQHVLNENVDLGCLQEAGALLLQFHNPRKQHRRYYSISILKHVFTYNQFGSFGELALITNKRRAAKLEVTADSDAHFAVLSKKDYRQTQYKVQNQILQTKITFLRQFEFLKQMSDSNMSGLSYSIDEYVCSRGQALYHEGLDPCDYLYFVKSGEFLTVKKVPVVRKTGLDMHNILDEDVFEDVNTDPQGDGKKNHLSKVVSMKKVRQRQNMLRFNNQNMGDQFEYVKICIHQRFDMFGYQELQLSQDSNESGLRHYTVICAKAGSTVVAINKNHLAQHMRRNSTLIEQQILKWKMIYNSRILNWQRMKESRADKKELMQETFESLTYQEQARQQQQENEREEEIIRIRNGNQQQNKAAWEQPPKEVLSEVLPAPTPVTIQEPKSTAKRFGRDSQQSVLDNRFNDFRKSLISSVTPQQFTHMKQFQAKLEEKVETFQVHSQSRLEKPQDFDFKRVMPESARLYSSMLHSSKIQTRINMKQQLFNYQSLTAKSRHASLSNLKKQQDLRSSIGSALGMPPTQVSDAYQLRDMSRIAEPTIKTQFPRIVEASRTATNLSSFRYGQVDPNQLPDRITQSQLGPQILGGAYNTLNAGEDRSDVSGDVRFKNSILTSQLQQDNHYGGTAQMNASIPTNLRSNPTEEVREARPKMKTAMSQPALQKPEEFADWNKESKIVQNQCSKFFMTKKPSHLSRQQLKSIGDGTTQESAAQQMGGLGGSKTQLLGEQSRQPTRQSLNSLLNENMTDQSMKKEDINRDRSKERIYKDIQQTVQQSINPSKQFDADKDLEDITDFKNQNQPSIFEVLQDWNLNKRDAQSEKRSNSPPLAAKVMKKNPNLLQNPLLNKALKRSVFTSIDARSHAVGVQDVDTKKRKLLIYSKKNQVSYNGEQSMHPNNRTLQQNKTELDLSVHDSHAISYQRMKKMLVTDSHSLPYEDQDASKKSKKQQTQTLTFHGRLNTSQHEKEQAALRKSSEPKIIMRQLLFDKDSVNPKNIENQDVLRQTLVTNLIGEPEVMDSLSGLDKVKVNVDSQSKLSSFKMKKQAKSRKAFGPGTNVSKISKPSREPSRAALQVASVNKESNGSLGRSDHNISITTELMKNHHNASNLQSNQKPALSKGADVRKSKDTKKSDKQSIQSLGKNSTKMVPAGGSRPNSQVSITQTAHGKKNSSIEDGQRDHIGSINISDLDLLPEYRVNSRKRSPAEIQRVQAYHRDNHHNFKFVVDVQHAQKIVESKEEAPQSKSSNRTQRRKPRQ